MVAQKITANLEEWGRETEFWNTNKFEYSIKDVWEIAGSDFENAKNQEDHIAIHADMVERIMEYRKNFYKKKP